MINIIRLEAILSPQRVFHSKTQPCQLRVPGFTSIWISRLFLGPFDIYLFSIDLQKMLHR